MDMSLTALKQTIKRTIPEPLMEVVRSFLYSGERLPGHEAYVLAVRRKRGVEIGGPSTLFRTILPIYQAVESLDGVNFSTNTVWEGSIKSGENYRFFGRKRGLQYICEATELSAMASATYDFVLSSNCLEHVANPLRAILEWKRVITMGGAMILVLPNKDSNFDHKRQVTSFDHLLADYKNDVTEHDLTHLDEILAFHDLSLDPPAGGFEDFRRRSLDNFRNRTLHHHVFGLDLIMEVLDYCAFDVVTSSTTRTDFFCLATKRS
jgi:SAM-dependent methyltransferase